MEGRTTARGQAVNIPATIGMVLVNVGAFGGLAAFVVAAMVGVDWHQPGEGIEILQALTASMLALVFGVALSMVAAT